jgi:hypothetical protein
MTKSLIFTQSGRNLAKIQADFWNQKRFFHNDTIYNLGIAPTHLFACFLIRKAYI